MSHDKLIEDARAIWQAGVNAVTPWRLFRDKVSLDGSFLCIDQVQLDLSTVRRLIIVGAGKASAAMAVAFWNSVLSRLPDALRHIEVRGWLNCPEGTFTGEVEAQLGPIHLHAARPAGINEPTQAAVDGTRNILELVRDCDERDVVVCMLSGGGSALLVAPRAGVALADKQSVVREISAAGGNIEQLNAVRRALSEVKGGGLARACRAGRLITLIISDVLGDPLETIASGPTVLEASSDPAHALAELDNLGLSSRPTLANAIRCLEQSRATATIRQRSGTRVDHVILGNNADAVDAGGVKAVELGYRYVLQATRRPEGDVLDLAKTAAETMEQLVGQDDIDCWISGGEPTVKLPATGFGRGGRNQQLTLAVLKELRIRGWPSDPWQRRSIAFLSGGTDGEDGPTDAAGAWLDRSIHERAIASGLDPSHYLATADAYTFFHRVGGLLRTGSTGTNVCDLRVALAGKPSR